MSFRTRLCTAFLLGLAVGTKVSMRQVEPQVEELEQQRSRLREAIRRTGETLASNLDRPGLLQVALKTAVDGVHASCGRLITPGLGTGAQVDVGLNGSPAGLESSMRAAEQRALQDGGLGESRSDHLFLTSVALGATEPGGSHYGLITVGRAGRPFNAEELDLLRLLAAQTTLALENVELHYQVRRQAVTDELTGLGNYASFQELLTSEIEQVKRYGESLGLIMLDLDDFKSVNDSFGHQQGDAVLKAVARALRENCRDADAPVRYGGDELAVILPHTPLEGASVIAERVRSAIERLEIPRLDGEGSLRVTASIGVSAATGGDKDELITEADQALYSAKRGGKNRTENAQAQPANLPGD